MKIAIIGGTGAMGSIIGGRLAQAGYDVTLLDVNATAVDTINANGLKITDKNGDTDTIQVRATTDAASIGVVDLAVVFVKCFYTKAAVEGAAPLIGPDTKVLSLQNGWGNGEVIAGVVGPERVRLGVTYISGTTLAPGHVRQVGNPIGFIGNPGGDNDAIVHEVAEAMGKIGVTMTVSDHVLRDIWAKLALNVCTLPSSALLGFPAHQLLQHDGMVSLMKALLEEVVAVANAQQIPMDFDERWAAITTVLTNAVGARGSMLQDVDAKRQTEIDVINGAIVAAGQRLGIPTPYSQSMVWLMKSMQESYT